MNVTLCPDARVTGGLRPFTLNPVPVTVPWEIVALAPPVLVTVSGKLLLLPTCTLPKFRLACVGLRVAGVTPVPDTGIFRVGLEALLVIVRFPLTDPAVCGAKTTLKVGLLCPGPNVNGRLRPFTLIPAPVALA